MKLQGISDKGLKRVAQVIGDEDVGDETSALVREMMSALWPIVREYLATHEGAVDVVQAAFQELPGVYTP